MTPDPRHGTAAHPPRERRGRTFWPLALLGAALAAFVPAHSTARGQSTGNPSLAPRIDSLFAPFARSDSPGCAVGVYRAGAPLFTRGYGMANLEHGVAITPATRFNIASLSKQFTAFAIHLLARRGKLSLDDDIRRHLPELPDLGAPVTVGQLVHHTSGLRAYEILLMLTGWNRDHPLTREQVMEVIGRQRELNFSPGERRLYGNSNYVLLAMIVERVDGRPFREFMAQEVFAPLGMASTQVRDDAMAIIPGRAEHYVPARDGGFRKNQVWAFAYALGASNVVTTVEDLARWDANFYHERVGGPGIARDMYTPGLLASGDSTPYGGGLEVDRYRGLRTVAHSGSGGGDYYLLRFPDQRVSVAVLCNLYQGLSAHDLAYRVAELHLQRELAPVEEPPAAAPVTLAELAPLVGDYRDPSDPFARLEFIIHDGALANRYEGDVYPLVALGGGRFREGALSYAFTAPAGGGAIRLAVSRPGWSGEFTQRMEPAWRPGPAQLAAFQGTFRSEELDAAWNIEWRDGRLTLRRPRFPERVLQPGDRDELVLADPFEDMTLTSLLVFERGAGGAVTGFRLTTSRVARLLFTRTDVP